MGGDLESRCVSRVYGADGVVYKPWNVRHTMDSAWRHAEKYVVIVTKAYRIEMFSPVGYWPPS